VIIRPEWTTAPQPVPAGMPVPILQDLDEWADFYEWVSARDVKSVLEIGAFFGGTLWHWTQLPTVERIVSIDMPITRHDPRHRQLVECRRLWPSWMNGIEFYDILGDSQDARNIEGAAGLAPFDLAFIDGDHTAQGVRADWLHYSQLVRLGGTVVFHDTVGIDDVRVFVNELRASHKCVDFVRTDDLGITAVLL
jgi:cephalosporin hydroxylase